MRLALAGAMLLLAGCDRAATAPPTGNDAAIAAAERKAVADTDAALAEARAASPQGTKGDDDRFPR